MQIIDLQYSGDVKRKKKKKLGCVNSSYWAVDIHVAGCSIYQDKAFNYFPCNLYNVL